MKVWLLLCFSLLSADMGAPKPLVVSLGCNCGLAGSLRSLGLREAAYPFDWILSINFPKLIQVLDEDFAWFLDDQFLKTRPGGVLHHHRYHLQFSHEPNWQTDPETFKNKYFRRIERFREIKDYPGEVFFIRIAYSDPLILQDPWYADDCTCEISPECANRLLVSLHEFFPHVSLHLLILNHARFEGDREIVTWNDDLSIFRHSTDLFGFLAKRCEFNEQPPQQGED